MYLKKPNNINNMNKMIEDVFRIDWKDKVKKRSAKEFMIDADKQYSSKVV